MFSYVLIETQFTACGVFKKIFSVTNDQQVAYDWKTADIPKNWGREIIIAPIL